MDLKNKHALILGASKGIGKEIAFYLAGKGVTVATTYFDWPEESAATRRELAALGSAHLAIKADLRSPTDVKNLAFTDVF